MYKKSKPPRIPTKYNPKSIATDNRPNKIFKLNKFFDSFNFSIIRSKKSIGKKTTNETEKKIVKNKAKSKKESTNPLCDRIYIDQKYE
jgi:hypothetical protein